MGGGESKEKTGHDGRPEGLTRRFGYVSKYVDAADGPAGEATVAAQAIPGAYKILSVGCNYHGTKHQLASSVTDCHNHLRFLKRQGFVPAGGFRCLTDDGKGDMMPTLENIVRSLMWLVEGAQPGQSMYFHFSGHGATIHGLSHYLVPCDFADRGVISSDVVTEILSKTPPGSRVVVVADCAYACSPVNLPWKVVLTEDKYRWMQDRNAHDMNHGHIITVGCERPAAQKETVAGAGALSSILIETLDRHPEQQYDVLLRRLREGLKRLLGSGSKLPSLSSTHKFDASELFTLGVSEKDRHLFGAYLQGSHNGGVSIVTHSKYFVGAVVEGWFYNGWFPARIRAVNNDGTFDLDWTDGTSTMNVDSSAIRLPYEVGSRRPEENEGNAPTAQRERAAVDELRTNQLTDHTRLSPQPTMPHHNAEGSPGTPPDSP